MNENDKKLLLQDLCGRIPYGVKCIIYPNNIVSLQCVEVLEGLGKDYFMETDSGMYYIGKDTVKPILYQFSDMTESQLKEYKSLLEKSVNDFVDEDDDEVTPNLISVTPSIVEIDFFNKYHIDYRGLIPKGLAINAKIFLSGIY